MSEKRLKDALSWLLHLHENESIHGFIDPKTGQYRRIEPSVAEWEEALEEGR